MKKIVFLIISTPNIKKIKQVNKYFESENPDKTKLLEDLTLLIKSYGKKLILASHHIDILNCNVEEYLDPKPYHGYRFESKIVESKLAGKLKNEAELGVRAMQKIPFVSLETTQAKIARERDSVF